MLQCVSIIQEGAVGTQDDAAREVEPKVSCYHRKKERADFESPLPCCAK